MLRAVNTTCRVLLLAADNQLSDKSLATLERTYGDGLLRISKLASQPPPSGRRLYSHISQTVRKFWIWALDPEKYPLLFYLDLDVLVAKNIDDVFNFPFRTHAAATPCGAFNATMRGSGFNAGVLLMRPNAWVFREMLATSRWLTAPWNGYIPRRHEVTVNGARMQWYDACAPTDLVSSDADLRKLWQHIGSLGVKNTSEWPLRECRRHFNGSISHRIERVCAPKLGDQALHNSILRKHGPHAWTPLPDELGLNVDWRWVSDPSRLGVETVRLQNMRLVHFLSEPKPWDDRSRNSSNVAVQQYRATCPMWSKHSGQHTKSSGARSGTIVGRWKKADGHADGSS